MGNRLVRSNERMYVTRHECELHWVCHKELTGPGYLAMAEAYFPRHGGHGPHRHPNAEEIIQVISGRAEQGVADETYIMGPGDTVVIPSDVTHWTKSLGDEPLAIRVVFSDADPQTVDID